MRLGNQPIHGEEAKEIAQELYVPDTKTNDEVLARFVAGIKYFLSNENVLNKKRNEGK